MFPSSHDITPGNVDACLTVLGRLLEAGNDVLVVSKPRADIIKRICETFAPYREKILFRFTIGAMNNEILSFWEPNAPSYEERKMALVHALEAGYATSVSIEPMLDASHIIELIRDLEPFVTESIWIGTMNHIRKNIKADDERIAEAVRSIEQGQSDEMLLAIHHQLKGHPLIRFKKEIRRVIEQQAD